MVGAIGVVHAVVFEWARSALAKFAGEVMGFSAYVMGFNTAIAEAFSIRTDAAKGVRVEVEFGGGEDGFTQRFVVVLMAFAVFGFLAVEFRVTAAELVVRYVGVDVSRFNVLVIGFVGEAGVGGHVDTGVVDGVVNR